MFSSWSFDGLPVQLATWAALGFSAWAVLMYLLRPRPQQREVASLVLWQRVLAGRPDPLWRERLLLALQVVAIAALAAALTAPRAVDDEPTAGASADNVDDVPPSQRIWVVDRSLSMSAGEAGGDTRMDRVRALLLDELERLPQQVRVGLIGAGPEPSILAPCGLDRSRVGLAIRLLDDLGSGADLLAALRLAIGLPRVDETPQNSERAPPRIELFTDDPTAELLVRDFETATGWRVHLRAPFVPLPNVAITAFDLRATEGIPAEEEGLVRLVNHAPYPAHVLLTLETGDAILGQAELEIEAMGEAVRRYRFQPPGPTGVEAVLRDVTFTAESAGADEGPLSDGLATDDRAFAWLQAVHPIEVLLVGRGNRYLDKVLSLVPGARVDHVRPEDYDATARRRARQVDLVFFDGWAPDNDRPPRAFYIGPGAMEPTFEPIGTFQEPAITDWNHDHPVSRGLRLRDLKVAASATLAEEDGDVRLLGTPSGAAALARESTAGQKAVAWGFDFGASDLPLRIAFPQLIINTILWMREGRATDKDSRIQHPLGEPLWLDADSDGTLSVVDLLAEAYALEAADARRQSEATTTSPIRSGPQPHRFERPGLFRLSTESWERHVAVQVGQSSESNLLVLPPSDDTAVPIPVERDETEPPVRPTWQWLALFGLAVLVTEFGLYTR